MLVLQGDSYLRDGVICRNPTMWIQAANGYYIPAFTRHIAHASLKFSQMNEILGDDYEKKMAVVGVLKQYAEDRDIDILARALSVILKTPQHRRLLRQIR